MIHALCCRNRREPRLSFGFNWGMWKALPRRSYVWITRTSRFALIRQSSISELGTTLEYVRCYSPDISKAVTHHVIPTLSGVDLLFCGPFYFAAAEKEPPERSPGSSFSAAAGSKATL